MSELKYTATQMNNVLSSSQEYYRNWKEAEKINKELRARISELSQAVGLITTLKPTMVMDADHPLDMAKEVEAYVTARIVELEKDNAELKERFDITDGLLNQATISVGAVIACCTYNSNAEAMAGAYGISYRAFTMIDNFIKNYNRAVLDGKASTDVKNIICCPPNPPEVDENEKLKARITGLEAESERFTVHSDIERQDDKWIPVSERLPDNWESVLTIDISKSTRDMVTAFYNPETSLWSTHFSMYSDSDLWVTHWMPLPEPPIVYGKECE